MNKDNSFNKNYLNKLEQKGLNLFFESKFLFYFLDCGTNLYEVFPSGKIFKDLKNDKIKLTEIPVKLNNLGKLNKKETFEKIKSLGLDVRKSNFLLNWAKINNYEDIINYLVK